MAALGADPDHPFPIKIGSSKPVGLRSVLINIDRVVILEHTSVEKFLRHTGRLGGVINSEQLEAGLDVAGESAAQWLREQSSSRAGPASFGMTLISNCARYWPATGCKKPPHQGRTNWGNDAPWEPPGFPLIGCER